MNYDPDYVLFLDFLEADLGDVDRVDRERVKFLAAGSTRLLATALLAVASVSSPAPPRRPHMLSLCNQRASRKQAGNVLISFSPWLMLVQA